MKIVIPQMTRLEKLILRTIFCFFLTSCWGKTLSPQKIRSLLKNPQGKFYLVAPNKKKILLRLAITDEQKNRGLSGIMPENFSHNEGMLFIYNSFGPRRFWMPDTYFNLHIIYLDEHLKILEIVKNVLAHPGYKEPPPIPKVATIFAHHVLEMKASSPLALQLKVSQDFKWMGELSLDEIKSNIHLLQ